MQKLYFALMVIWGLSFSTPAQALEQAGHGGVRANEAPVVVLVPGFFNSLVPGSIRGSGFRYSVKPYFSRDVLGAIEGRGYKTVVVDNLIPVGTIEVNGSRLLDFLHHLIQQPDVQGRELILIAHSAGGLYSLQAMTLDPTLPVRTLVTLSTPYNGVDFVDKVDRTAPLLKHLLNFVRLESLVQLRAAVVRTFVQTVRIPSRVNIIAITGAQRPCAVFNCWRAQRLSWIFSLTQRVIAEPSDGLITEASAEARGTTIGTLEGVPASIERPAHLLLPLEHWEQVEDHWIFTALGTLNHHVIGNIQRDYFARLIDYAYQSKAAPDMLAASAQ